MIADLLVTLRFLVLAAAAVATVAALAAMAVHARRINPFGRTGRRIRRLTDPLLVPIERRLLRARLSPQHAPWWLIGVTIFVGILLLTVVEWVAIEVLTLRAAADAGSRGLLFVVLDWVFGLLSLALIVRVIGSWVGASAYSRWMRPFVLATEWLLAPLRRIIPSFAMFDVTPLVAWFLIQFLRAVVLRAL
jgi:YggT family protein